MSLVTAELDNNNARDNTNNQCSTKERSSYLNFKISHLKQKTKNDCGVACLKMAINYVFDAQIIDHLKHVDFLLCELDVADKSLWTIDLAHVCALKQIRHQMYTITLGVDENFSDEHFYSSDRNFDSEKKRIGEKFNKARELEISVEKKSVNLDFIKSQIAQRNVCIILVNASLLNGTNLSISDDESSMGLSDSRFLAKIINDDKRCFLAGFCFSKTSSSSCSSSSNSRKSSSSDWSENIDSLVERKLANLNENAKYLGHFLVLIGYDDNRRLIFYRNPATSSNFSYTSYLDFEMARKSYGTDQDILLIYV